MRTVIIGTPGRFQKITRRDLPADKNLDYSFWRYVDFSRLDLRDYSMQNVDIINYDAHNSKLPQCHYSQFRFPVDNIGITIPPDVSSFNHDLVAEVFRQATNASDPIIQRVYTYLISGYDVSWRDGLWHLLDSASRDDVESAMTMACAGYPRLLSRLQRHFSGDRWDSEKPAEIGSTSSVKFYINDVDHSLDFSGVVPFADFDRTALAEMMTISAKSQTGEQAAKVYLAQLHPFPVIFTAGDDDTADDWWKRRVSK